MFDPSNLTDQEQARLANLKGLIAAGIDPYPARVQRTHTIAEARALYESGASEEIVVVTGRLKRIRDMGKMSFANIEDGSGTIQILLRRDNLPEGFYNNIWKKFVDLGDFIGATGPLTVTKTGEVSVDATSIQFLSKTLKPMPDKWHGVRDRETRYRRRYVDLIANPEVRDIFRTRAAILRALREYFDGEGFLEVETPILQPIYGGAAAKPFVTHHNQLHQDLYLRISFELYLKRLIVGGFDRVYEIGRDFRNEGVSFKHNPEFTQLEFYEAYTDYEGVMRRTEEMMAYVTQQVTGGNTLNFQGHTIDMSPPWRRIPLREAILEASDIDYEQYPDAESLAQAMRAIGLSPDPNSTWGKLVDGLMARFVEPNLIQPTFLIDYPLDISPLAKGSPDDPRQVERFEGFIGGMEFCNAFSELNDPIDQLQRFVDENYRARHGDDEAHPIDEDFIDALSFGMPPTGGFGMGIDRLTMIFTDKETIREVILFPHLRSLKDEPEAGDSETGESEAEDTPARRSNREKPA
ncbi:MAG: lysine--tRNA ligase [Caldilineaceae bacterium]|nr:lysine--tRNA ligase [Caldilineaceae bacterium]